MTHTKLLVIISEGHMSTTALAEFTARVQLVAEKVGAELLVLGPGQCADLIITPPMPSKATAGEIKEGLRNCSASRKEAYWASVTGFSPLRDQVQPLPAIQGEAISACLDPLEQAIESTVRMLREEATSLLPDVTGDSLSVMAVYGRMVNHLDALLAQQLNRVSADETV